MEYEHIELDKQLFWFNIFQVLPYIVMFCNFISFFVLGVVDAVNMLWFVDLEFGVLIWFVWMLIGAVISAISFLVSKSLISQKVLEIYYLQKISGEKGKPDLEEKATIEVK